MDYLPSVYNFSIVEVQATTVPGTNEPATTSVLGPFETRFLFTSTSLAAARAYVFSLGGVHGTSFDASGEADSGDGLSWFAAGVNGPYTGYGAWFSLSPYTELVISGWATMGALASGGNEAGVSESNAFAQAWISFTGPEAYGGGGSQSDLASVSLDGHSYYGSLPFDQTLEQPLQIRFVNGTDTAMDARFEFAVYASGMANPVPEPASWALMLGGLVAVGAALRPDGRLTARGRGSASRV